MSHVDSQVKTINKQKMADSNTTLQFQNNFYKRLTQAWKWASKWDKMEKSTQVSVESYRLKMYHKALKI